MSLATLPSFNGLKLNFRGEVLLPHSSGYDAARKIWNAMIDKRPAAIARCTCVEDVVAAVNYARDNYLDVSIRSGGHNIAGSALCNHGLVIDLTLMNNVDVSPAARRARVGAGATLAEFDAATQKFGLATPVGINSTTGIAGLTLGGGFGWLTRRFGMTVDNLVSADVVVADGRLLHADATTNPELFWALRGGGGNFGVVTSFEFALHPVGPEIFAGLIVFPQTEAKSVLQQHRTFIATAPEELNVWAVLRKAPPLPFLPPEVHGRDIIALAVFHAGKPADAIELIQPLRQFAPAHGEHLGIMPLVNWQQAFDPLLTPGARNYWKSHNVASLTDGLIDTVAAYAARLPSPQSEIFLGTLGGAASRVPADAMAYGNREANFVVNVHGRWEDADSDAQGISWARGFHQAAAPFATGSVYVNFMTADETDRINAAYGSNYRRLVQVKAKYDPTNLFHVNQNIRPSAAS
jgi:FAD/FMN-containing dehydrogenase